MSIRPVAFLAFLSTSAAALTAQGRGMGRMSGVVGPDDHFLTSDACALCHSAAPTARAMWNATGDDVSPFHTWQATMMANSFRDPYWRAQVSKEVAAAPERRAEIEGLCLRCHGPIAHHEARLAGAAAPSIAAAAGSAHARDGVSCTVCHQVQPGKLGREETFSGNLPIVAANTIFGPYSEPAFQPMRMHTGYTVEWGPHVRDAGLCGACHTLFTSHTPGHTYPEQTPFLEWRNSVYSDEEGRNDESRTCQQCHMPAQGELKIARNPRGLDFNIATRPEVRAHAFVGGNAFMLDLLAKNRDALGVEASAEGLRRTARATRQQLAHTTASLAIEGATRAGDTLTFAVRVTNRTGHKLPTGYPARRAWLRTVVRIGNEPVFVSGDVDEQGRLRGVGDERALPHVDRVTEPKDVVVYECIPVDVDGKPTTHLTKMVRNGKDTRLLPKGWRADGPHAEHTAPRGLGGDTDFVGGEDVVHYELKLPPGKQGAIVVVSSLLYQTVPPAWVDPLRNVDTEEAERFVGMYDAMDKEPESLALTVALVN
ncbi:MAG: multiheme c-type cytochrome [Planctomycetota bacterium]